MAQTDTPTNWRTAIWSNDPAAPNERPRAIGGGEHFTSGSRRIDRPRFNAVGSQDELVRSAHLTLRHSSPVKSSKGGHVAAHAGNITVGVDLKPRTGNVTGVAGSFDNVEINHSHADTLIGQLLTLIDATFTDAEQRKAQKQLVKRTVRDWVDDQYSCKAGFGKAQSL